MGEWVVLLVWAAVAMGRRCRGTRPWGDEAQAWMLARGNGLWALFRYRLHYEGTPGLWHLLLRGMVVMGAPWGCGAVVCGGVGGGGGLGVAAVVAAAGGGAVGGAAGVLDDVPVCGGGAELCAVSGDCYLGFVRCTTQRPRRVVWFAVMAGLLGNLCLQGALCCRGAGGAVCR